MICSFLYLLPVRSSSTKTWDANHIIWVTFNSATHDSFPLSLPSKRFKSFLQFQMLPVCVASILYGFSSPCFMFIRVLEVLLLQCLDLRDIECLQVLSILSFMNIAYWCCAKSWKWGAYYWNRGSSVWEHGLILTPT